MQYSGCGSFFWLHQRNFVLDLIRTFWVQHYLVLNIKQLFKFEFIHEISLEYNLTSHCDPGVRYKNNCGEWQQYFSSII